METACKHRNIESACKKPRVKLDSVGSDINMKQRKSETHLKRRSDKFCEGGYPNALDYLFAVSHATDNITQVLDNDDDEETEEYNVEDYLESSSPSPSAQTVSDS